MPSKRFMVAPTVADTLTVLAPNPYQMPPGNWEIYRAIVAFGNVANATANAGFLHIETVERSYDFAYGGGLGGATNSGNTAANTINMSIHAPGGSNVVVYLLSATAEITAEVSLQFRPGTGNPQFRTMAAGGVTGTGDTVALTEKDFSTSTKLLRASLIPDHDGRIYQIRMAGGSVVDAKSGTGYIRILIPNEAGPFEFAFNSDNGGAATGGPGQAQIIDIPEGIPVHQNSTVNIKITTLEACKYPHISLSYW